MSMDKKALIELIKEYKELPCLWDQTHSLYANKEARNQAYNTLLENLKCYQKDCTLKIMKKKIENMRMACKREYKKVMATRMKGLEYRPTLWYYDLLSFIHNDADDADDDDNTLDFTEVEQIDESNGDKYDEYEEDEIKPKRLKVTEVFVQNQNNVDNISLNNTSDSIADRINDEEALAFGRTVGLQLRELDNYQRILAEKLISDTIFFARLGKLTTNSTIEHK